MICLPGCGRNRPTPLSSITGPRQKGFTLLDWQEWLGAWVLWGRKGTTLHRSLGWTWVALMTGVAVSGAFIRDYHLPNLYGFTPIHLFVLMVAWQLPRAVVYARSGRIDAHRKAMRGLYQGGCLIAGVLTLLPGRFLGTMLWRQLGLMT